METIEFTMETKDLVKLGRFFKSSPSNFVKSVDKMLNEFAFGTRAVSLNIIRKRMVVRNERFVSSRLRAVKSYGGRMMSQVGSVKTARFTGWVEQEGAAVTKDRIFGLAARKGNIKNVSMGVSRLKPGSAQITPEQFEGKSERFRNTAMIMYIRRKNIKKPFVIKQHTKYKKGLYRYRSGKIEMLQQFKTKPRPPKVRWLSGAVHMYMTPNRVRNEWSKILINMMGGYK